MNVTLVDQEGLEKEQTSACTEGSHMHELRRALAELRFSWAKVCLESDDSADLNNFYSGYQRFFLTNFSTVGNVGESYKEYLNILKDALR